MDPYGNVVPAERDVFGNAVEGTPDPRNEYSDPLGRGLYSAFDEDDMGNSVVLDIEDDFGPINPDDEYKHELGYFLVLLLRGDSLSRQLKQDVFKMSVAHCIMGPAMLVISAVEDEKFSFTPYFKATMYYGSPLLDLQYTTSIFAIAMGWLGLLAVHHWASVISNRDLFTKLCKGFQALLAFMFALSMWQMCVFFRVFQGADFSTEFHMQEIYGYYVFSIIFMLPYIVAALMYGLNLNYLQEMVDEGGLLEEPAPLPEHAMDLADVNVLDILGLCMLVPALIISQVRRAVVSIPFYSTLYFARNPPF
jgi:hypothetical protein